MSRRIVAIAAALVVTLVGGVAMSSSKAGQPEYRCVAVVGHYGTLADGSDNRLIVNEGRLAEDIETAMNDLAKDGYEVTQISEITRGNYDVGTDRGSFAAGWSVTGAYLIIARKR